MYQTSLLISIILILVVQNSILFWKMEKSVSDVYKFWIKILVVVGLLGTVILSPPMQLDVSDPNYTYIRVRSKFESRHLYYEEFLNNHDMRE